MAVQAKDRLLESAIKIGRRDGWSRLTVTEVLADSEVARRSLYTHFPDGAGELVVVAVRLAADWITAVVDDACKQDSPEALATFIAHWKQLLEASDYELGCPVATAATSRPQHPEAAALAARAFEQWEKHIAAALVRDGVDAEHAKSLSLVSVACIEGAVLRCMAARSSEPLDIVRDHLASAIVAAVG